MELTQKIGTNIAARRKAKGMTQEQLAAKLGVSAPAVSKWETGSSCPDIALLCPLARALDTNVDTLLQFEETLSDAEVTEKLNALLKDALHGGASRAQEELQKLLRQYPNCTALQYNAAAAYDAFQMFFPDAGEETNREWKERKRALLEEVRAGGNAAYWQGATIQLASLAVADGSLEEGAALLRELPEHIGDPSRVWAFYYLKKDEPEQALKLTQKQLYKLVSQTQSCLATMMDPRLSPEPEQLMKLSRASRAVAQAFGLPDMSDAPMMEAWLRMGELQRAVDCFIRYVDAALAPACYPDPQLFSPGLSCQRPEGFQATTKAMRRMLLKSIEEEEKYRSLYSYPAFAAAVEKLRASV